MHVADARWLDSGCNFQHRPNYEKNHAWIAPLGVLELFVHLFYLMFHFALRRSTYPDCVSTFFAFLTFLHSTALGFGFMGMMIGVLQKSHAQLCDKYSKLSLMQPLHWIPIAVLFVLKYVVALVIYYFEVMHRNGVSYAGMTGETVFESAKRAQSIMATDGALVLTEHSGTGNRILFV